MIVRTSLAVTLCLFVLSLASASFAQVAPASPTSSGPPVWTTSCIYCPKRFNPPGDHYLAVDADGRAHLAYGGDALYYTVQDAAGPHVETVDPTPGIGAGAALSLGSDGQPMIAYYDPRGALKLAQRVAEKWQVETVDAESGYTSAVSLHVDRYYPWVAWIAYISQTTDGENTRAALNLAVPGASSGHPSLAAAALNSPVSLDLSPVDNRFGIAFVNEDNALTYVHEGPSDLYTYPPILTDFHGENVSLAIDGHDTPHVMYTQDGGVYYAHYAGSTWTTEPVDDRRHIRSVSLRLDVSGQPHFVGYSVDKDRWDEGLPPLEGYAWYGWRDADGWHMDAIAPDAICPDLAFRPDGGTRVAYLQGQTLQIADAGPLGGWHDAIVDRGDALNGDVSLALDAQDQPRVLFQGGQVMYAARTANAWNVTPILHADATPQSLAIDASGQPHVTLVQRYGWPWDPGLTQRKLLYAHLEGGSWTETTIESSDVVESILAADTANRVQLAYISYYYNYGEQSELRYAADVTSGSSTVTGPADNALAMVLDSAGNPHMSFAVNSQIGYRRLDGTAWQTEKVGPEPEGYRFATAIALDPGGRPVIAYIEAVVPDTSRLQFATRSESGWQVEQVAEAAGQSGLGDSLGLVYDAQGVPHLVFVRDGALQHAWRDGGTWRFGAIDPSAQPYGKFSVARGANNRLQVAYVDWRTNDIRLAEGRFDRPTYLPLIVR